MIFHRCSTTGALRIVRARNDFFEGEGYLSHVNARPGHGCKDRRGLMVRVGTCCASRIVFVLVSGISLTDGEEA